MSWPERSSLQVRIAGGSFLVAVLIALISGLVLDAEVGRILRENTLDILRSDAEPYVLSIQKEPGEALESPGPSQFVLVQRPDGSEALNTFPAPLAKETEARTGGQGSDDGSKETSRRLTETNGTKSTELTTAGQTYVLAERTVEVDGTVWSVHTARDIAAEDHAHTSIRLVLVIALALLATGAGASAWMLTRLALRPVNHLRRNAEALMDDHLGAELLDVPNSRDEISALAGTLNSLIVRLRAVAVREHQLVSDASHELRTPLALVSTQLQLARSGTNVDELRDDIAAARRNVERMSLLVDSLLELSALEAEESTGVSGSSGADAEVPGEGASVAELVDEVVDAVDRHSVRAEERGVDVVEDLGALGDDGSIALSPEAFARILDNLVTNAVRETPEGGRVTVSMQVSADSDGRSGSNPRIGPRLEHAVERAAEHARELVVEHRPAMLEVVVADTGPGMPPDFVAHAFDRFTRSDESRAHGGGTGLGLAITRALVERGHGTITLDNHPGEGLRVIVRLPLRTG